MGFWGGAGKGAVTGAAVGSSFGVVGMVVGAVIGGLIGGIAGWLGGKSKKAKEEEARRAKIAQMQTKWDMQEDRRIRNVTVGASMLDSLSGGSGNYGGHVNLSGMAIDPEALAKLKEKKEYDFSALVPDESVGSGYADAAEGLDSVLQGAGGLAGYMGSGGGGGGVSSDVPYGVADNANAASYLGGMESGSRSIYFDPNNPSGAGASY